MNSTLINDPCRSDNAFGEGGNSQPWSGKYIIQVIIITILKSYVQHTALTGSRKD